MPKRERYVWVCTNERKKDHPLGSCTHHGGPALQEKLKRAVNERGLKSKLRVMTSSCLDVCWNGAAMAVMPDGVFVGGASAEDAETILEALLTPEIRLPASKDGPRLLSGSDFDLPEHLRDKK